MMRSFIMRANTYLTGIILIILTSALEARDIDSGSRISIERLVRDDGYSGPLTIKRDDTSQVKISRQPEKSLVLFEASEGGPDPNPDVKVFHLVDNPRVWRVLVDLESEH